MAAATRQQRVLRIALLLLGMYALLAARLFHVQVTTADDFAGRQALMKRRLSYKMGRAQFERGHRGRIFDARGRTLALGYDTFRLMVDPNRPHRLRRGQRRLTLGERVQLLSDVLTDIGVDHDAGELRARGTSRFFVRKDGDGREVRVPCRSRLLVRGVLPHERRYVDDVMRENHIRNFFFEPESQRDYPEGALVAEVVGWVGRTEDDSRERGRAGIEMSLESTLAGRNGRFVCEKDGLGREIDMRGRWEEEPRDGDDVGLTLDLRIQGVVDEALARMRGRLPCDAATAVVLETRTGRILGLKSRPDFSVEDIREKRVAPSDALCRPVTDCYPPGSTFKPFVIARALESGVVSWDDRFDTNDGARVFRWGKRRRLLRDSHPHGVLTAREIMLFSSNIGMAIIGFEKMGYDRLYEAIDSWGFREEPGVRLPGEGGGWYTPKERANPISAGVSMPFGHEIMISPLALAAKFSVFGADGIYHEPRIVDWTGRDGARRPYRRSSRRLVSSTVAREVRDVLADIVEEGTAKVLRPMRWSAAAKTGTAQIMGPEGFTGSYSSAMVALAPVEETRITVYVGIHGVEGSTFYAGQTVGPAMREIIEGVLELLEVPPDEADREKEEVR